MILAGKTALVTGGGKGIGRAICLELARLGVSVAINYSGSEAAALETAALIEAAGGRAFTVRANVAEFSECESMFEAVTNSLGAPDILVNNSGITRDNLIPRMSSEDFSDVLSVNLSGAFHCTKLAVRPMMKARWGRIVNIASAVGLTGNAGQANYSASKAGLIALTKTTAREFASRGITANAITPGFITTDMTAVLPDSVKDEMLGTIPQKRFGDAGDIAGTVAFFCSDAAAYITGQTLGVDGGMTMQ